MPVLKIENKSLGWIFVVFHETHFLYIKFADYFTCL